MKQYGYDSIADYYDYLDGSLIPYKATAISLNKTLRRYGIKILDVACGTGNFANEFKKLGYAIEGCDISKPMLKIAKLKNKNVNFFSHDMKKPFKKKYDIVLCMFNSVGHLKKEDFFKTLKNFNKISKVIVFDIFNLEFMKKNFISNEFIDMCHKKDKLTFVRFNNNSLDKKNKIMNINQKTYVQKDMKIKLYKFSWQMKIYNK